MLSDDLALVILCELAPEHLLGATLALYPLFGAADDGGSGAHRRASVSAAARTVGSVLLSVMVSHLWDAHCQGNESKSDTLVRCLRFLAQALPSHNLLVPQTPVEAARLILSRVVASRCRRDRHPHSQALLCALVSVHGVLLPRWAVLPAEAEKPGGRRVKGPAAPGREKGPAAPRLSLAAASLLGSFQMVRAAIAKLPKPFLFDVLEERVALRGVMAWAAYHGDAGILATLLDLEHAEFMSLPPQDPALAQPAQLDDWDDEPPKYLRSMSMHRLTDALEAACTKSDLDLVRLLLTRRAADGPTYCFGVCSQHSPLQVNRSTPLDAACLSGHESVVRLLLDSHLVNIETQQSRNSSPLVPACLGGHLGLAQWLVRSAGARPTFWNAPFSQTRLPIQAACASGMLPMVQFLLESGASASENEVLEPTLMCQHSGGAEIFRFFLGKGVLRDLSRASTFTGDSVWKCVSQNLSAAATGIANVLLDHHANLMGDVRGFLPLHYASMYANVPLTRLLLSRGARADARSRDGSLTPLDMLVRNDTLRDKFAPDPLGQRMREVLQLLLEAWPLPSKSSSLPIQQLNAALRSLCASTEHDQNLEATRMLLDAGAEVNDQRRDNGWTALHHAVDSATGETSRVVHLLLLRGADATICDRAGKTPLSLSLAKRSKGLQELLQQAKIK